MQNREMGEEKKHPAVGWWSMTASHTGINEKQAKDKGGLTGEKEKKKEEKFIGDI